MTVETGVHTSLTNLLGSLSRAIDLTGVEGGWSLRCHGQQVATTARAIAEEAGLDEDQNRQLFLAALVHDVGISSSKEKLSILEWDLQSGFTHSEASYDLLRRVPGLGQVVTAVRHHHDKWAGPNESGAEGLGIPLLSRIIHLADRICILIKDDRYVLHQRDEIVETVQGCSGTFFMPDLVAAFRALAAKESFWLDLSPESLEAALRPKQPADDSVLSPGDLLEIASLFARVVDNKSRFTHQHSVGVTRVAAELARRFLMPEHDQVWMRVAGLLHDLGKLAVPDDILEKQGRLTDEEMDVMRQHTYYTFHILAEIPGFEAIAEWAAFHHERLDGKGYPFHRDKTNLSLEAKIMCVADGFQALNQNRPYRPKLPKETVLSILSERAEDGALEPEIVSVIRRDYADFAHAAQA